MESGDRYNVSDDDFSFGMNDSTLTTAMLNLEDTTTWVTTTTTESTTDTPTYTTILTTTATTSTTTTTTENTATTTAENLIESWLRNMTRKKENDTDTCEACLTRCGRDCIDLCNAWNEGQCDLDESGTTLKSA